MKANSRDSFQSPSLANSLTSFANVGTLLNLCVSAFSPIKWGNNCIHLPL